MCNTIATFILTLFIARTIEVNLIFYFYFDNDVHVDNIISLFLSYRCINKFYFYFLLINVLINFIFNFIFIIKVLRHGS